jgi:hypothetical protein
MIENEALVDLSAAGMAQMWLDGRHDEVLRLLADCTSGTQAALLAVLVYQHVGDGFLPRTADANRAGFVVALRDAQFGRDRGLRGGDT